MTTARLERAVRRNAAASLTAYRRAASRTQGGPEWREVAAGLASAVDMLLGVLDDSDGRLSVAWDAITELRARADRDACRLDAYDQGFAAIGTDIGSAADAPRPRFTLLPGGRGATGEQAADSPA